MRDGDSRTHSVTHRQCNSVPEFQANQLQNVGCRTRIHKQTSNNKPSWYVLLLWSKWELDQWTTGRLHNRRKCKSGARKREVKHCPKREARWPLILASLLIRSDRYYYYYYWCHNHYRIWQCTHYLLSIKHEWAIEIEKLEKWEYGAFGNVSNKPTLLLPWLTFFKINLRSKSLEIATKTQVGQETIPNKLRSHTSNNISHDKPFFRYERNIIGSDASRNPFLTLWR